MSHQSELIATDIHAYLAQHERKELLRLLTCGSVDDGKSTLIGRMLHDSKMIYEDQLMQLEADSKLVGTTGGKLNRALPSMWLTGSFPRPGANLLSPTLQATNSIPATWRLVRLPVIWRSY